MECIIPVEITPSAVAKLILQNAVKLSDNWSLEQSQSVIEALARMPIEEVVYTIDSIETGVIYTDEIPQFGNLEALEQVPYFVIREGTSGMNYAQLGFRLKNDVYAKMDANIKFGENHGKGAALLGLVHFENQRFFPSSLSTGFCNLEDKAVKDSVVFHLFFRIPIVQAIIKEAKDARINGYSFMDGMKDSTKKRRGQCLRAIFRTLGELENPILTNRLSNIFWEIDE